jgi:hypothetical protein
MGCGDRNLPDTSENDGCTQNMADRGSGLFGDDCCALVSVLWLRMHKHRSQHTTLAGF